MKVDDNYGNYVRTFMSQLCGWGILDFCMAFRLRVFDFFYSIVHSLDNFQNCATMNCQRNVSSILPTELPYKFSYIVAILIHNNLNHPILLHIDLTIF
jgi:hypothetical protein